MPSSFRETVLCRYHYDPLDRQNGCTVPQQPSIQQFHNKDRLTTEIHGASRWSFFQHDEQLLAQRMHLDANATTVLLATDQQRSVLNVLDTTQPNPLAYTPYGHRPAENGLLGLLGFNGERPDPVTGHYHLGNGYRQFNPVLMRFNSPDSWSPFGEGGLNVYGYCGGDPRNRLDTSGHFFTGLAKLLGRKLGLRVSKKTKLADLINNGDIEVNTSIFFDKTTLHTGQFTKFEATTRPTAAVKSNKLYLTENFENDAVSYSTSRLALRIKKQNYLTNPKLDKISAKNTATEETKRAVSKINKALRTNKNGLSRSNLNKAISPYPGDWSKKKRSLFDPSLHADEPDYWANK